jgi:preprotein translocase subunit SecD
MAASGSALTRYLKRALLTGLAALCAFGVAALVWSRASRRTCLRAYRARKPPERTVAPEELERAASVLRRRIDALRGPFNIGRAQVRAVPPDRLAVELSCGGQPQRPLSWLTMQGRTGFHLVHPDQGPLPPGAQIEAPPGYEIKLYRERRYVLTRLNELETVEHRYLVQPEPMLVVPGFERAELHTAGPQKLVILTFHLPPAQARELQGLTALHAGRQMAMLIDGEMFFPPARIGSAVSGGSIRAEGFFHARPLRLLVSMLNCGSLPWPLEEQERGGVAPGADPDA